MTQVGDLVKTDSYKMIMASDKAEFDSLWNDLLTKADALGLKQITDWTTTEWEKAKATVAKYQ